MAIYHQTKDLRWSEEIHFDAELGINARSLQQRWVSDSGDTDWRDIEIA